MYVLCMYVWTLPGKVSKYYAMKSKPQVLTLHVLYTFMFLSMCTTKAFGIKFLLAFASLGYLSADSRTVI